jgi:hypothetical protein
VEWQEILATPATEASTRFALEPLNFALLAVRRNTRRFLALEERSDASRHFGNGRSEALGFLFRAQPRFRRRSHLQQASGLCSTIRCSTLLGGWPNAK